ncbi:MAG: hypothetical protein KDB21_10705 [Acidimicrobiales bacterium]|nr:hypothetical protein [Acidimicrobiales bacterium]
MRNTPHRIALYAKVSLGVYDGQPEWRWTTAEFPAHVDVPQLDDDTGAMTVVVLVPIETPVEPGDRIQLRSGPGHLEGPDWWTVKSQRWDGPHRRLVCTATDGRTSAGRIISL